MTELEEEVATLKWRITNKDKEFKKIITRYN